ncbi:polyphosphate:nucleotide phosphotransferase, PPK2 family [Paraoerskovia marina]|uniref:Polyphosphate:nucleotide phosphotransferase, PPK2 family n=1 Tax=Paraoerskovia marina TaxID=545619 RepID=A0A1H1SGW5_9CELL|nr:polyphosphate kinase 2 family protein [Paraoerskovia marina]SDS47182.1 polyphosphate:nucleotide phosphotransferase, PPK2 family [Paraoerskovia marina]
MSNPRTSHFSVPPTEALRVDAGFDLSTLDPGATPGWDHGRKAAEKSMARRGRDLSDLQERLFAHGRTGGERSVLLVLQGMDTAGKGGIVRHVIGMVDPQGVDHAAFAAPTAEELAHDFLWRIRRRTPRPGMLGVFDRSHYEDVLIARVDDLVPRATWEARYDQINEFEAELAASGTTIVKVAMFVSLDEQKERLRKRLERPDKHWKYDPSDLAGRAQWPAYQEAYQAVLDRTSTPAAPWYVVPADHKWYSRLVVTELVLDAFRSLDLDWPTASYDVAEQLALLERS